MLNRKRSRVGYELISMQDDDLGDIEEGGRKWQENLTSTTLALFTSFLHMHVNKTRA